MRNELIGESPLRARSASVRCHERRAYPDPNRKSTLEKRLQRDELGSELSAVEDDGAADL